MAMIFTGQSLNLLAITLQTQDKFGDEIKKLLQRASHNKGPGGFKTCVQNEYLGAFERRT
jgi:hypothetical protein